MRVDLALIGFGNVGRRFARLLEEQRPGSSRTTISTLESSASSRDSHGAVFCADAIDGGSAARVVEAGGRLDDLHDGKSALRPSTVSELIDLTARSNASARVVVETTTLDIQHGQAGDRPRRRRARSRLPRRDREQGTGRVRLRRPARASSGSEFVVLVRRRGDGRRAGLQSGSRDAADRDNRRDSAGSSTARRTTS